MTDDWAYTEDTRGSGFHGSRGFGPPRRQTHLSRMQHGAAMLGISLEAYLAHREAGESWCSRHRAWHPLEAFGVRMRRGERVVNGSCRAGAVEAARESYLRRKTGARES